MDIKMENKEIKKFIEGTPFDNADVSCILSSGKNHKLVDSYSKLLRELKKIKKIRGILIKAEGNEDINPKKILYHGEYHRKIQNKMENKSANIIWGFNINNKLKKIKIKAVIVY